MKKKTIAFIIAFIAVFIAAIFVLITANPYAFNSCGGNKIERQKSVYIQVFIKTTGNEHVYSCQGEEKKITLEADTDYTMVVGFYRVTDACAPGFICVDYDAVDMSVDNNLISVTPQPNEKKLMPHYDYTAYGNLDYKIRGSNCSEQLIELNFSSGFCSKYGINADENVFTSCSFTVTFI